MKIKVSEAEREVLDWMVAKAEGLDCTEDSGLLIVEGADGYYVPSMKWSQGGPIIEREEMTVCCHWMRPSATKLVKEARKVIQCNGDTPLIAAMRCYVASKLGDEVEIPDTLTGVNK